MGKEKKEWDGVVPNQTELIRRALENYKREPQAPPPAPSGPMGWLRPMAKPEELPGRLQTLLARAAEAGEIEGLELFSSSPKIDAAFFKGRQAGWAARVFQKANPEALAWLLERWCLPRLVKGKAWDNEPWVACLAEALANARGDERVMGLVERGCDLAGETKSVGTRVSQALMERAMLKARPEDLARLARFSEQGLEEEEGAALRSAVCSALILGARQKRGEGDARGVASMAARAKALLAWVDGRPMSSPAACCAEFAGLPGLAPELLANARAWGVEGASGREWGWGLPAGVERSWDGKAGERRFSLVSCALYQNEGAGAQELLEAGAWWGEEEFFEQRQALEKGLMGHGSRLKRSTQLKCANRLSAALRLGEALALGGVARSPEAEAVKSRPRI